MKQFCKITYLSLYMLVKYVSVSIAAEQKQLNIPNLPLHLVTNAENRYIYKYSLRLATSIDFHFSELHPICVMMKWGSFFLI